MNKNRKKWSGYVRLIIIGGRTGGHLSPQNYELLLSILSKDMSSTKGKPVQGAPLIYTYT